jgi:ABC-type uncharacterized transport system permease subunit
VRRLVILAFFILLLVIGGGLTSLLINGGTDILLPVLTTTEDPTASREIMQGWKAEQLFLLIGFIAFNIVGIAATLAVILWLLDRSIQNTKLKETGEIPKSGTTVEVRNADKLNISGGSSSVTTS